MDRAIDTWPIPAFPPMKTRYVDLIEQTFDFPKDEFNSTMTTWSGTICR